MFVLGRLKGVCISRALSQNWPSRPTFFHNERSKILLNIIFCLFISYYNHIIHINLVLSALELSKFVINLKVIFIYSAYCVSELSDTPLEIEFDGWKTVSSFLCLSLWNCSLYIYITIVISILYYSLVFRDIAWDRLFSSTDS